MKTVGVDRFPDWPEHARLWVIGIDRPLDTREQALVLDRLSEFFRRWEAHGRRVVAQAHIEHERFIVIGAYVPGDDVSGCGIDASVHELENISELVGFSRAPVLDVFFAEDGKVRSAGRAAFAELVRAGTVGARTTVYDTSVSSVGEWRNGRFAQPFEKSWHASVFS